MEKIRYNLYGAENKQTIIFIHGAFVSSRMWEKEVHYFKDYYKVITYDLRGHGVNRESKADLNFELYSKDLKHLIEHVDGWGETRHLWPWRLCWCFGYDLARWPWLCQRPTTCRYILTTAVFVYLICYGNNWNPRYRTPFRKSDAALQDSGMTFLIKVRIRWLRSVIAERRSFSTKLGSKK